MNILNTIRSITFTIILQYVIPTSSIFTSDPPFYSQEYASVNYPRTILIDDAGDMLVSTFAIESNIYLLYEVVNETDGSVEIFQDILLEGTDLGLNHGLSYNRGYLYVSSASTVYRWVYQPGQRTRLNIAEGQVVVWNMPLEGVHATRTIVFDTDNLLYVQVGAADDVDPNSFRAKIRRFNLDGNLDEGINFETGEVSYRLSIVSNTLTHTNLTK